MSHTILVTGAAGFIGSHFCRYWALHHPTDTIIALDKLTYAGVKANVIDIPVTFIKEDIVNQVAIEQLLEEYKVNTIVNFAAESHNSYAIKNPKAFYETNCIGVQSLCAAALTQKVQRVHHVSTCEVYGDLDLHSNELFSEDSRYAPRTPYNASKAAGDHVVRSYYETFELPISITNCANNYGSHQFPEKLIPWFTVNALQGKPLTLYKTSDNRREWIHALDHCRAIDLILQNDCIGQTYHVGTGVEKSVEEIADIIIDTVGVAKDIKTYIPDRPGHDRRYALDYSKITKELGWEPEIDWNEGIKQTIEWYRDNQDWWQPLLGKSPVDETKDWKHS